MSENNPKPTKRKRRSQAEIQAIREAIYEMLMENYPITARQVFYGLVNAGVIAKTEAEFKSTVSRLLLAMCREEVVPYDWITDYCNLEAALQWAAETYRRELWNNQGVYVAVWTEKAAIAGVLYEETRQWDVPLMVNREFSSYAFLYEAAQVIKQKNKPAYLFHFGDYDPSGVADALDIERRLRGFAPGAEIHFKHIAVTPEQILEYDLPKRPTKESVEVEAIPPKMLRQLVEKCITQHVNKYTWRRDEKLIEKAKRAKRVSQQQNLQTHPNLYSEE